jgi:probable F420-dependent oxidoreductase
MDLWLNLASVNTTELIDAALVAEECGVAGVALADHLVHPAKIRSIYPYSEDGQVGWKATTHWPDAWVAMAAMAAVTSRLRFTTAVYVAPLRDPVALAKSVSTAAVISGGRVGCGFGTGWMQEEFDVVGQQFGGRGRRTDEMIEVLRKLWTGEMVEHHGEYYGFDQVQMSPPPPGPVPVWIGGNTSVAMRRAVRNDGWIGAYVGTDKAVEDVRTVRALRAASEAAEQPFAVSLTGPRLDAATCARLAQEGVDSVIVPLRMLARGRSPDERRAGIQAFMEQLPPPRA